MVSEKPMINFKVPKASTQQTPGQADLSPMRMALISTCSSRILLGFPDPPRQLLGKP